MKDKLFSRASLGLMLSGLLINIFMVYIAGLTKVPLYLDSIGTMLAAILGGVLPGITVGFFSNMINYVFSVSSDPLTLYYGIISVLLAVAAAFFAQKGMCKKIKVTVKSIFVIAMIGGGFGSVLTWLLYGLEFGENASASIVLRIYQTLHCPPFVAQLTGDYLVDVADKGISIIILFFILKILPVTLLQKLPYGYLYINDENTHEESNNMSKQCRKRSLKVKLTVLILCSSFTLGLVSIGIGMWMHCENSLKYYENSCENIANTVVSLLDGNEVVQYDTSEEMQEEYKTICRELSTMEKNIKDVDMISVFRVEGHRSCTIFNISDNGDTIQSEKTYIVWPGEVQDHIDKIEEKTNSCIQMKDKKTLVSVKPVYDNSRQIVAYVAVQMNLRSLNRGLNVYFIRIFSLLFGIGILIVGYVFWFYDRSILKPIQILIQQTKEASKAHEDGVRLRDQVQVTTGDELEILFEDMCEAEDSIVRSDVASKSKTEFLSKLSHEIRTPLNSVIGFSELAMNEKNVISKEELLDYMQKIQISGKYLLELVSDVLDISRIEEGRMTVHNEACRLDDVIEEVVDAFQGQMKGKKLDFVVDKNYGDVLLFMDDFHTIQILNNLISNACKYTEEGGVVGFEIHSKKLNDKKLEITYIVQDTGIGMSEEFQKQIFEPFTQDKRGMKLKNQLRGSGLGMSICKNLVDLLGGTIELESEEGEGSCFTVKIVYEIIGRAGENDIIEAEDYSILKGKKILVVDDLEMNRIVVEKMLSSYKLEFIDAEDGLQAVEAFKQSEEGEYFAIFMDVQMPEMNGLEATKIIRGLNRKDHNIPILGMTADAFSDDVEKTKKSGMNYHVTKPIQVHKVLNILMEIAK